MRTEARPAIGYCFGGGVALELARSGAVHGFTNPNAGNNTASGYAYNAEADHRSWQAMQDFFNFPIIADCPHFLVAGRSPDSAGCRSGCRWPCSRWG